MTHQDSHPDRIAIRGGTVVDGSGGEPFKADLELLDGRISKIGDVPEGLGETIDATGRIVTPGFVDVHTHYDGQVTWTNQIAPSSAHGVTTVVMGNCGVGFAPCHPQDRTRLVQLLEGVEDIPEIVFTEGLPWTWETFPEYMDFLASRRYDIDFGAYLPHAALRVFAMGERGARREDATPEDRRAMRSLVAQAARAGAMGFSTSRSMNHRSSDGSNTPMYQAATQELVELACGLKDAGAGLLQMAGVSDPVRDMQLLREMAMASGRPVSFSLAQSHQKPDEWRSVLRLMAASVADGVNISAQVCGRSVGMTQGLDMSLHPFIFHPSYRAIAHLSLAERVALMRGDALREKILAEEPQPIGTADPRAFERAVDLEGIYELGEPPNYEPSRDQSIAARARAAGTTPLRLAYELLLRDEGRLALLRPIHNYAHNDLEVCRELLLHPNTNFGLGDGGAHLGYICDAGLPTFMLTYWTRDRAKGGLMPLPGVVKALTSDLAQLMEMKDRGRIAVGLKADINVIDYENLHLKRPHVMHDLPGGGRRLLQDVDGYDATIVSGVVTQRRGKPTGMLPGRLVRGAAYRAASSH